MKEFIFSTPKMFITTLVAVYTMVALFYNASPSKPAEYPVYVSSPKTTTIRNNVVDHSVYSMIPDDFMEGDTIKRIHGKYVPAY